MQQEQQEGPYVLSPAATERFRAMQQQAPRPQNGQIVRFVSGGSVASSGGPMWVETRPEDIQKLLDSGGVQQQPTLARFRSSDMEEAEKKAERLKKSSKKQDDSAGMIIKPKQDEMVRFVSLDSGGSIPSGPVWIEERPEDIEKLLKSGGVKAQPTIARFISAEIPDAAEMDRRILAQSKRQREEGREREGAVSKELAQPKNVMMMRPTQQPGEAARRVAPKKPHGIPMYRAPAPGSGSFNRQIISSSGEEDLRVDNTFARQVSVASIVSIPEESPADFDEEQVHGSKGPIRSVLDPGTDVRRREIGPRIEDGSDGTTRPAPVGAVPRGGVWVEQRPSDIESLLRTSKSSFGSEGPVIARYMSKSATPSKSSSSPAQTPELRPKEGQLVKFVSCESEVDGGASGSRAGGGSLSERELSGVWVEESDPGVLLDLVKNFHTLKTKPAIARFRASDGFSPVDGEFAAFISLESAAAGVGIPRGPKWLEQKVEDVPFLLSEGGVSLAVFMRGDEGKTATGEVHDKDKDHASTTLKDGEFARFVSRESASVSMPSGPRWVELRGARDIETLLAEQKKSQQSRAAGSATRAPRDLLIAKFEPEIDVRPKEGQMARFISSDKAVQGGLLESETPSEVPRPARAAPVEDEGGGATTTESEVFQPTTFPPSTNLPRPTGEPPTSDRGPPPERPSDPSPGGRRKKPSAGSTPRAAAAISSGEEQFQDEFKDEFDVSTNMMDLDFLRPAGVERPPDPPTPDSMPNYGTPPANLGFRGLTPEQLTNMKSAPRTKQVSLAFPRGGGPAGGPKMRQRHMVAAEGRHRSVVPVSETEDSGPRQEDDQSSSPRRTTVDSAAPVRDSFLRNGLFRNGLFCASILVLLASGVTSVITVFHTGDSGGEQRVLPRGEKVFNAVFLCLWSLVCFAQQWRMHRLEARKCWCACQTAELWLWGLTKGRGSRGRRGERTEARVDLEGRGSMIRVEEHHTGA